MPGRREVFGVDVWAQAIAIIAVLLLGTHGGPTITPTITPTISLFQVLGYNLIVVSSVLILRVLFRIFTPGR